MTENTEPVIPNLGLLVLDVQESFLKAFQAPDKFVNRVAFCMETANLFGLPTLLTEQRPDILGPTIEKLLCLDSGVPRIAKTGFSAFTEPTVQDWIQEQNIEHLLVVGLETPICVYQTAIDSIHQDIEVTILSDAVGARRSADAEVVLRNLRIQGAHVLPAETVFYSILRDSRHPVFKEFTRLVKKYSD